MAILTGDKLKMLLVGSTHYVDVGKDVDAVIFYASETDAHMRPPGGPTFKGTVDIRDDGYTTDWIDGPTGNWRIDHVPGAFSYIGPDGNPAGTVTKIVPGNPEGF
ncbi:MAG: hypothetical protein AAGF58_12655 [Pseudomonadota bacterium]